MTAPGERLTPQQMRADYEMLGPHTLAETPEDVHDLFLGALAAWQADREALEAAQQEASLRFGLSQDAEGVASGFRIERDRAQSEVYELRTLLRRARGALEPFGKCGAWLDANGLKSTYGDKAPIPDRAGLRMGDLRAAASVLAELDAAQGEGNST